MALCGFPQVAECIKGSFTHVVFIIIYGKDVAGQPGVTQEVGPAHLKIIHLCIFENYVDLQLMRTSSRDRWFSKLGPTGCAIFKIPQFSRFLFCWKKKILCWCPTKMLNISQHLIDLYLSTFSIISPCVNFPSRQQDT